MKTKISDKEKDYSLHNFDNYIKTFNYEIDEVIEKYIILSNEFLKFVLEKKKFKNDNYSKFIIIRGYETITNIFNIMLYFTKNLDLTFYHCQKSYYYYFEFIEQISYEQHIFLQLNSKDAATYVYKKTLFELHDELNQSMQPYSTIVKNKLQEIDEYIKIFKIIFDFLLEFIDFDNLLISIKIINKFKLICQTIHKKNNATKIKKLYNNIELINNSFLINKNNTYNNESGFNDYSELILQGM